MFLFFHPRPPSRKEVAAQIVAREAKPPVNTEVIIVDSPTIPTPPLQPPFANDTHARHSCDASEPMQGRS